MEFNRWYKNENPNHIDEHVFLSSIESKKYPGFFYGWVYKDGELEFRDKLLYSRELDLKQENPILTWAQKRVLIKRVFRL